MRLHILVSILVLCLPAVADAQIRYYRWANGGPPDWCGASRGNDLAAITKRVSCSAALRAGRYNIIGSVRGGEAYPLASFDWDGSSVTSTPGVAYLNPIDVIGHPWTEVAAYVTDNAGLFVPAYGGFSMTGEEICTNDNPLADPPRLRQFSVAYHVGWLPSKTPPGFNQQPP